MSPAEANVARADVAAATELAHSTLPTHLTTWQQHDADEFGMWLFLATEVLFFGGLFLAYGLYRLHDEAAFATAIQHLDIWLGTFNTAVLLTSSLIDGAGGARGRGRAIGGNCNVAYLARRSCSAAAFLGIKAIEYSREVSASSASRCQRADVSTIDGPIARACAGMFFMLYFLMTGLHALHMVIGIGVMAVLSYKAREVRLRTTPVHVTGICTSSTSCGSFCSRCSIWWECAGHDVTT